MAYTGPRPILPGRTTRQVNPVTGVVETSVYSNFDLESDVQAFQGAPLHNHVPGTGYFPGDVEMERRFEGLDTQSPMDDPGLGPILDPNYYRTNPDLFKGVPSADAVEDPGHLPRDTPYSVYSNFIFDGVPSADILEEPGLGHIERDYGETGVASGLGATDPYEFQGVPSAETMEDPGKVEPAPGTAGVYGHEHVQEYFGVPSAKAL